MTDAKGESPGGKALVGEIEGHAGRSPDTAQGRFARKRVEELGTPASDRDRHTAFLSLLLDPRSKLSQAVEAAARRAHRETAGALRPYVEPADLLSLVRWKLCGLPPRYFRPDGVVRERGILAFLGTVARHVALDEVRRLSRRAARPEGDLPVAAEDPQVGTLEVFEEVQNAFDSVTARHPKWLREIAMALLLDARDAQEALVEINAQRAREGLRPWAQGSLASFLSRLRGDLRLELSRQSGGS